MRQQITRTRLLLSWTNPKQGFYHLNYPQMSLLSRTLFASGAISLAFLIIRLARLSRRLRHLPGPASPSLLFGNALDLERSRVGLRYNVWEKKYGSTYRIRGPLSVLALSLKKHWLADFFSGAYSNPRRSKRSKLRIKLRMCPISTTSRGSIHPWHNGTST